MWPDTNQKLAHGSAIVPYQRSVPSDLQQKHIICNSRDTILVEIYSL